MNCISEAISTNLLDRCKRNVQRCFINNNQNVTDFLFDVIVEILMNGFKLNTRTIFSDEHQLSITALQRLIDDFEWIRQSAQLRNSHTTCMKSKKKLIIDATASTSTSQSAATSAAAAACNNNSTHCSCSAEEFLKTWTQQNLQTDSLCACLQSLIGDAELLEYYYINGAFLRSEYHATALLVCLSALELNECSLLSQIANDHIDGGGDASIASNRRRCQRLFSSHPNFTFLSSMGFHPSLNEESPTTSTTTTTTSATSATTSASSAVGHCAMVRKVKSLPCLWPSAAQIKFENSTMALCAPQYRRTNCTTPVDYHKLERLQLLSPDGDVEKERRFCRSHSNCCNRKPSPYDADQSVEAEMANLLMLPSSASTMASSVGIANNCTCPSSQTYSITTTNTSSMSSLASTSSNSHQQHAAIRTTTSRPIPIQVIKCDDIKIWTDQSVTTTTTKTPPSSIASESQNLNDRTMATPSSSNPVNSFLQNLFRLQPSCSNSYSNSFDDITGAESAASTAATVTALPTQENENSSGGSASALFNSFRIPYGKKLQRRKSQNLFYDDGISYLDYSPTIANDTAGGTTNLNTSTNDTNSIDLNGGSGTSQSDNASQENERNLPGMLQMSLSHNHTELEKENAHFSIAEAIIAVIEHIKWAKFEPDKGHGHTQRNNKSNEQQQQNNESSVTANEHIAYAEVGESCIEALTAEVVGLSLMAKFNNTQQWPLVNELKWLVGDDDTPQQLLPMPARRQQQHDDDGNKGIVLSTTRGTTSWAPPRKQIIFTDHPAPNRRELLQKQNNRCAGCGMHISVSYMQSLRYCTYLGKYHCTGCHRNQISAIPAKILQAWDFKCYPVSVFAYRLLDQMYAYPLFYVPDLNPLLYERANELRKARQKRVCMKYAQMFIKFCPSAEKEQLKFATIPSHLTAEPDLWSMCDFINARRKHLQRFIDTIITQCEKHIVDCVLCTGRGFICECCHKGNVIYPWQNRIERCEECGSCYHEKCWKSTMLKSCLKCQRINQRNVHET